MREEIYDFLVDYGFSIDNVEYFQDENEKTFFTNINEVKKNINFLENKGLSKEEVISIFIKNPYMLTVKDNKLNYLDNIYIEKLKINNESLKKLILDNPYTYIESPIEIEKIINYLKENKCSEEVIKKFILENPLVISMKLDKVKEKVSFKSIKEEY